MSSEKPNGQEPETRVVAQLSGVDALMNDLGYREWMSFDPMTDQGKRLYLQATLKKLDPLEDQKDQIIKITNFYANDASRRSQVPGEIEEWIRIVVFDDTGKAYTCGSKGVLKSLAIIQRVNGKMPYAAGYPVIVRVERLEGGRVWMTLEPHLEESRPSRSRR